MWVGGWGHVHVHVYVYVYVYVYVHVHVYVYVDVDVSLCVCFGNDRLWLGEWLGEWLGLSFFRYRGGVKNLDVGDAGGAELGDAPVGTLPLLSRRIAGVEAQQSFEHRHRLVQVL